jgi:hypothetical protein
LRKETLSFVVSVCSSAWNNSNPTGRILIKLCICLFVENMASDFKLHYSQTRITGTSHKNVSIFMVICR